MEQKIIKKLKNKNIILFGVNEETVEFYTKFYTKLHIKFCVTSYSENVTLQPMKEYGIETFLYDDVIFTEEDYLVICDSNYFQPLERRLQTDGLVEYEQYVSAKLAESILTQKEIMVLMGSLVIKQLKMALINIPEIDEQYACFYYSEAALLKPYANKIAEYTHIARFSDIYIVSVCDKNMYKAKVLTSEKFFKPCQCISISDYTFNGYYPQVCANRDMYSQFLFRERKRMEIPYSHLVLAREDANLRKMVYNNVPVDEIVEKISSDTFYSQEQVVSHFENALDVIRKADETADIKLAGFVDKNCRKEVGYCSIDEWNGNVLNYVLERVLEKIGFQQVKADKKVMQELIETGTELPIYPSVRKHLGIEEYQKKQYKVVSFYQIRYMEFEEYIRYCANAMYQIKELQEFLGIEGV